MADFHAFLWTDDAGSLDHVTQLTNIARPAVIEQRRTGLLAEAASRTSVLLDETRQKAVRQGQNVFAALTQGWQIQGDHVQAVQQILTETSAAHHVLKVEVGGGQDAHVGTSSHRVADALVFLVLNEAQQLGLQRQRKVADLVEKQGAAIGLIDTTQRAFAGTGESAAAVAEQFAFHQFCSQRRAVDGDAGLLGPLAPAMNSPGQLALTGTRLAQNQDVGIGDRHLTGRFQNGHHRRAVGIQTILGLANLAFQCFETCRQLPDFKLLGRCKTQLVRTARLDQIVGCASLNGIDSRIHRRMGSHDHHTHPRRLNPHLRQHVQAIVFAQT